MPRAKLSGALVEACLRAQAEGEHFRVQARRVGLHAATLRSWVEHRRRACTADTRVIRLGALHGIAADHCFEAVAEGRSLRSGGLVVNFRLSPLEYEQLVALAREEAATKSDVIREALYEWHGIGELAVTSLTANSAIAERSQGRAVGVVLHHDPSQKHT